MGYELENIEIAGKLEKNGNWQELLSFCKSWTEQEPRTFLAWQGMGDSL